MYSCIHTGVKRVLALFYLSKLCFWLCFPLIILSYFSSLPGFSALDLIAPHHVLWWKWLWFYDMYWALFNISTFFLSSLFFVSPFSTLSFPVNLSLFLFTHYVSIWFLSVFPSSLCSICNFFYPVLSPCLSLLLTFFSLSVSLPPSSLSPHVTADLRVHQQ